MDKTKAQLTHGIIAVITNIGLFAVKYWAGVVTGSIAIVADAWHTLSDTIANVIVIISAKAAAIKPDKYHPFGHGRLELISSMIIALILGTVAYDFFTESIDKLQNRESVVFGTLSIVVTSASIIIKEILAQHAFYIARKTDNVVLKAEGWHHRSDCLSSIAVLIGILSSKFIPFDLWWMDSVLGIIIAALIFYAAFSILKEAVSRLLGEYPDQELVSKITDEVKTKFDEDLQLHHFHMHNYITHKEMTLHIKLNENMTIRKGHEIASDIEIMIKEMFEIDATIHVEPLD